MGKKYTAGYVVRITAEESGMKSERYFTARKRPPKKTGIRNAAQKE